MKYRRSAIEIESPEQFGYENIAYNLAESSVTDANLKELGIEIEDLILQYGDHRGKPELRELIADESGGLSPDDVLITVGAAGGLYIVATSLLEHGDHVVVAFPNYVSNIEVPRAIGCEVNYLNLSFDQSFRLDSERLADLITPQTGLVSLTSPHNPTGSVIDEFELQQVIELVESNNCYLLFDETYRGMTFGEPLPLAASLSPRAISISSLSKTYGLPGIRLGWLMCQDRHLMETCLAAKELIHISHSVVDEEIAFRYLKRKSTHLAKIKEEIDVKFGIMKSWMNHQDELEWCEPAGGVVCFPRIRQEIDVDIDRFYQVLNTTYKTFVGPGHWFESERRYMRIGYGWPTKDDLEQGLQNISRAIREAEPGQS